MSGPSRFSPAHLASRIPRDPYRGPAAGGDDALRLDGNEGGRPDEGTLAALREGDEALLREYPSSDPLVAELAARFAVAPECVAVTTGADDALDRICRAFLEPGRTAVLPVPTFEMLRRFIAMAGGAPVPVPWNGAFPVDDVLAAVTGDTGLIAVVSPNNPTGETLAEGDLVRLAEGAPRCPILLDHAYVEYADHDLTATALGFANVAVVRTLSKAWGLAGCRVGYVLAAPELAAVVRNTGNPYPVPGPSIRAAVARLQGGEGSCRAHVTRVRGERRAVTERLGALGVSTTASQGSFVFAELPGRAEFVQRGLRHAGVLTRRFGDRPEAAGGLRISMPDSEGAIGRLTGALELVLAPEALLLDLDGVLADVSGSYRRCVVEVAASYGVTIGDAEVAEAKRAGDANNDWVVTRRLLAARGVAVPLDDVVSRYQALYLGTPSRPGLRETESLLVDPAVVGGLRGKLPLAVVTGRPRDEAEWFLRRAGVREWIDVLVTMEDGPVKPDPAPVRLALERLGCGRAWMVGDTPDDVRAAAGAGVLPIGIIGPGDDPGPMGEALERAGAAVIAPDLDSVGRWIA